MARTVAVNPPKTPCTTEARGMAKCTTPNVCKMPGPPAPFVPTPLPNIGKSNLSPKGYSKTVKIEGQTVAIRGATFASIGDIASKGTGGGLISCNTHGPTKFITPGSLNVKIEGKAVHLLGEPMLNNCGPSGSPPNTGATMLGFDTWDSARQALKKIVCECDGKVQQAPPGKKQKTCAQLGREKHACCEKKIRDSNDPDSVKGEQGFGKGPDHDPIPEGTTRADLNKKGGKKALKGTCWPDATVTERGGQRFVDFKFRCPPNTPVRKKKKKGNRWIKTGPKGGKWPTWTKYKNGDTQKKKYGRVGAAQEPPITKPPKIISNKGCRK